MEKARLLLRLRVWLGLFIVGLALSGATAFPLRAELRIMLGVLTRFVSSQSGQMMWLNKVHDALESTGERYPFLAYGTDWLAFGHLVIALAFVGAWRDPIRNKWLFTFGLISCAAVVPLAMIAGEVRGIPFYWRLIDCSFGVFGAVPLLICKRYVTRLEQATAS